MSQEYGKGIFQEYAKEIFQQYGKGGKTTHTSPITKLTPMPKYTKIQKREMNWFQIILILYSNN